MLLILRTWGGESSFWPDQKPNGQETSGFHSELSLPWKEWNPAEESRWQDLYFCDGVCHETAVDSAPPPTWQRWHAPDFYLWPRLPRHLLPLLAWAGISLRLDLPRVVPQVSSFLICMCWGRFDNTRIIAKWKPQSYPLSKAPDVRWSPVEHYHQDGPWVPQIALKPNR